MSAARARPAARRVVVDALAKLNLTLAVGPRRQDGFHDLVTVFQSVSLADTLIAERHSRGFALRVRHEDASAGGAPSASIGAGAIPRGTANLVLRAARRVGRALELPGGARFTLVKRIPAGTGLGGASADAAAVIGALPALYGLRLGARDRRALALELGSDVAFALRGGTALGLGRGERLRSLRLEAPFTAIVAVPRWRVSTAQAYARIDRGKYVLTARSAFLRSAQILGRKPLSAASLMRLGNTFERVLGDRRSDLDSLRGRLRGAGAVATRMTGSGSAVFGILGPDASVQEVVGRFAGSEALYVVRSTRSGSRRYVDVT